MYLIQVEVAFARCGAVCPVPAVWQPPTCSSSHVHVLLVRALHGPSHVEISPFSGPHQMNHNLCRPRRQAGGTSGATPLDVLHNIWCWFMFRLLFLRMQYKQGRVKTTCLSRRLAVRAAGPRLTPCRRCSDWLHDMHESQPRTGRFWHCAGGLQADPSAFTTAAPTISMIPPRPFEGTDLLGTTKYNGKMKPSTPKENANAQVPQLYTEPPFTCPQFPCFPPYWKRAHATTVQANKKFHQLMLILPNE